MKKFATICCAALMCLGMSFAAASAGDCCSSKCGTTAAKPAKSGVEGTALQYPVFGNQPTFKVKPSPVVGVDMVVTDAKSGKEVGRVKTDKDGKFQLDLPAGDYKISASNGKHWNYSDTFKVNPNERVKLKMVHFRYNGPPIPSAGGPRPN